MLQRTQNLKKKGRLNSSFSRFTPNLEKLEILDLLAIGENVDLVA
jgi:hypothetical protein